MHLAAEEHNRKRMVPTGTMSSWSPVKANVALGVLARRAGLVSKFPQLRPG